PVLFLAACSGGTETKKETPAAPAASAPPAVTADAGSIAGKVAFSGAKPVIRNISMDATPACARQHSTPPKSEEVVLNSNGTLKNVFVWLKAGVPEREFPAPSSPVVLDQHTCIYQPHVIGVVVGQEIEIRNSDDTNHNVHPLPKINREWNESQAPKSDPKRKSFPREEVMIAVKCNVHPWMRSYVGVVRHPYFAITGDDGTFTIKDVPPGEYTVEAWHEKYGTMETKVTVAPKESKSADFDFKG
ncbi:MAG: carboxypeptidase regulatory-like domain-containing protein, partial [Bryobacteraceae bacterium]